MDIICAWCGEYIGKKIPIEDNSESPGICQDCLNENFPDKANPPELSHTETPSVSNPRPF